MKLLEDSQISEQNNDFKAQSHLWETQSLWSQMLFFIFLILGLGALKLVQATESRLKISEAEKRDLIQENLRLKEQIKFQEQALSAPKATPRIEAPELPQNPQEIPKPPLITKKQPTLIKPIPKNPKKRSPANQTRTPTRK